MGVGKPAGSAGLYAESFTAPIGCSEEVFLIVAAKTATLAVPSGEREAHNLNAALSDSPDSSSELALQRPGTSTMKFILSLLSLVVSLIASASASAALSAGAAVVDVTPNQMPVLVNGGMLSRTADAIKTRVNARALVLSDGKTHIGLVVVDSCMIPKQLLDDAKHRAASRTDLKADHIMISATHTHTAPSSFAALGTEADMAYVPFLREKIVEALVEAEKNLQPARVGFGSAAAAEFTALRRWVRRPDRIDNDPFGNPTVRANMHSARVHDNVTGPSGPEDPELSMIAVESTAGQPIAILTNFSMHYFGDKPISADYFGLFCDGLEAHAKEKHNRAEGVVGIMSHGCSGDIWRRDYMTWNDKTTEPTIESYTQGLLQIAKGVYDSIEYSEAGDLAFAEARLPMKYRVPNAQLLQWATEVADTIGDGPPKDRTQVYAREQLLLHQMQQTEVVVQAIRIGEIGIATTPNETYALTGMKLKLQSPLKHTMVIELANGADGYIPPPEQHHLGGYNTWAARSAGLEVQAEPRIVSAALGLLEQVSGQPRKPFVQAAGPACRSILKLQPVAYWRMDEMESPTAIDRSGNHRGGVYETGVLYFLEGPAPQRFTGSGQENRCPHFAGGRMRARLDTLGDTYSLAMSFWNGMPNDARETAGWMFSRDHPHGTSQFGDHLGLGGTSTKPGRIIFQHGQSKTPLVGTTEIKRWSWNRLVVVRDPDRVRVFLSGKSEPEIDAPLDNESSVAIPSCFIGGRSDNHSNWEGRIDEVAIFDRALSANEIAGLR